MSFVIQSHIPVRKFTIQSHIPPAKHIFSRGLVDCCCVFRVQQPDPHGVLPIGQAHTPFRQLFSAEHWLSQLPQLDASFLVSMQPPEHAVCSDGHPHTPEMQSSPGSQQIDPQRTELLPQV